jgi:hypothetical protein
MVAAFAAASLDRRSPKGEKRLADQQPLLYVGRRRLDHCDYQHLVGEIEFEVFAFCRFCQHRMAVEFLDQAP